MFTSVDLLIAAMDSEISIHVSFIRFMVGTIPLIAFLSLRNTYLTGRTRELCDKIRDTNHGFREASYFLQLSYFLRRYKISNSALIFSITAVFFFGAMIASYVLTNGDGLTFHAPEVPEFMLLIGGVAATFATGFSIYETYVARRYLFAEVATTIITGDYQTIEPSLLSTLEELERTIKAHLDRELHGRLVSTKTHLARLVPRDQPTTGGADNRHVTDHRAEGA